MLVAKYLRKYYIKSCTWKKAHSDNLTGSIFPAAFLSKLLYLSTDSYLPSSLLAFHKPQLLSVWHTSSNCHPLSPIFHSLSFPASLLPFYLCCAVAIITPAKMSLSQNLRILQILESTTHIVCSSESSNQCEETSPKALWTLFASY